MNCNTEFERTNDQGQKIVDTCNMLQVGITDVTVEQILKDHLAPEEIDDDWKCSKCNSVQKCLKKDKIFNKPKVLIIALKRFETVGTGNNRMIRKITNEVENKKDQK